MQGSKNWTDARGYCHHSQVMDQDSKQSLQSNTRTLGEVVLSCHYPIEFHAHHSILVPLQAGISSSYP